MYSASLLHERADRPRRSGRVVICLENRLLAESLATVLAHRGWSVEAVATSASAGLDQVALYAPDVCVVGATFLFGTELQFAGLVARAAQHTRVVVMGPMIDRNARAKARAAGVAAVISEHQPMSVVSDVLERVASGEIVNDLATVVPIRHNADLRRVQGETGRLAGLTSREREVLAMLADGRSTGGIADSIGVSAATVRSHIQSVFGKLGVHSRLRAVAIYRTDCSDAAVQAG